MTHTIPHYAPYIVLFKKYEPYHWALNVSIQQSLVLVINTLGLLEAPGANCNAIELEWVAEYVNGQ